MIVKLILKTEHGDYESTEKLITDEQYEELKSVSSGYYSQGGFEMETLDGFVIFSPYIVSRSILTINIIM